MAGQFDTWLREQSLAGKGGVRLQAASRARLYVLGVSLPGDWTGATLRGEVHAAPDSPTVLAEFQISGPVVDAGRSLFTVSLGAGTGTDTTGALPADGDLDGVEEFPVDFLLTPSGGAEELLFSAVLPLTGRVTV